MGNLGTPPKLGWNKGGWGQEHKKRAIYPKRCKIGPSYYNGLIGRRIRAFDWCQNQWPWMTLNGQSLENVTLAELKQLYGAHHKNFNEHRSILSATKCRPMILVSRNIRNVQIFAGIPRGGGDKYNTRYRIPVSKLRQLFSRQAISRYTCCELVTLWFWLVRLWVMDKGHGVQMGRYYRYRR